MSAKVKQVASDKRNAQRSKSNLNHVNLLLLKNYMFGSKRSRFTCKINHTLYTYNESFLTGSKHNNLTECDCRGSGKLHRRSSHIRHSKTFRCSFDIGIKDGYTEHIHTEAILPNAVCALPPEGSLPWLSHRSA